MTTEKYNDLMKFEYQAGLFKPANEKAIEFADTLKHREVVFLEDKGKRDLKFHKGYFALLNHIYSWLPEKFKMKVNNEHFYIFLKELFGEYEILYTFKDGQHLKKYKSIAFGKMTQKTFETYVRNQLPLIYDNIIHALYKDEKAAEIIEDIEFQFEKYLALLQ